jgi:hypothetical protein
MRKELRCAVSKPRPGRVRATRDRRLETAPCRAGGRTEGRGPRTDEQAQLARDPAALIQTGLIVAVDDGPKIRYAADGGEEVLP